MSDNTYNGWTNYETWAVAIWLDSDQSSDLHWTEQTRRHQERSRNCPQVLDGTWTAEAAAKYNLADQLKEEISGNTPDTIQGVYTDLLNAALTEVNWDEIAAHYLAKTEEVRSPFGPVVFAYTRAQAIDDGVLVDVTETANETGLKYPTALTVAAWQKCVVAPDGVEGQDEQGRLWDIVCLLRHAISTGVRAETRRLEFTVSVRTDKHRSENVTLTAVCGPGDDAEPVITVMLPHED
jgi:hypothetical protein